MNEKFLELPEQKRYKILNAAMEVFGKNEYKRAITDDIAQKAGISKGLLFYYFSNKKSLYLTLFEYCNELLQSYLFEKEFYEITDFFEMMEYGANKKMTLLEEHPYIMDFIVRAYYSQNETISEEANNTIQGVEKESFQLYFSHVDFTKFKEDCDPQYVYQMLVWMCDGYLHEVQGKQQRISIEEIMTNFTKWETMFRQMFYKEEFL